jgi:serine/threonine protein kinase/tetratricopeptide (TPR) repeat protein
LDFVISNPMTPAQLQTIKEIFQRALDCEPDRVNTFLETECHGDKVLRHEVEAFLTAHQRAGAFMEAPVVGLAAKIIETEQTGLLIGQTVGHYKISKRISAGGMGEVYLASDITVGRSAALKLLPAHLTGDVERLKRFQQEARVVAGLNHPNILTVYEVGADNSTRYIASELIEGETLRERLTRGRIELGEAIEIGIQVAGALAAAHDAGVVHRDVKPENIMLRPDGYVKVLDFGIAKLAEQEVPEAVGQEQALKLVETNASSILGTVSYMSPEQSRGAHVDKRTDIWSLGIVLYEMVAGRPPFTGDTPREVIASILAKEPLPFTHQYVQAPEELRQIVTKALQKNADGRFQSAREMLDTLKGLRRKLDIAVELESSVAKHPLLRWTRSPIAVALALLIAALAVVIPFYWLRNSTTGSIPEKSIAVLPFNNLSNDREDAFLADGLQDDLLTKLAKIADLKTISRTSVMQYRGERNLRDIGNALRVSHVLEGSVRKTGSWLHINAQLIDARSDTNIWAEQYDRDFKDVFAIQSEIAEKVAQRLHAKMSLAEKLAIDQPPTSDLTAFDLYSRAKNILLTVSFTSKAQTDLLQAIDLLTQAVARDPSFFQAYCQLALAHDNLYFAGIDRTPERLALAEAAIQAAFNLRPDAGEAHLARARNLYFGYLNYEGALAELELARKSLPNDPGIFELTGYVQRRQGKQEEALRNLERAIELDPRNFHILQQTGVSYHFLRRHADEEANLDRLLAIEPNDVQTKAVRAWLDLDWKADTRRLHQTIESIRATNPDAIPIVAEVWLNCALSERDAAAAETALAASRESLINLPGDILCPRAFLEAVIARMRNDEAKAQAAFTVARTEQEKIVQSEPDFGPALCVLGLIDAALGHREQALREGRRAIELMPVEKDAYRGNSLIKYMALIAAWVGENNLACEQLTAAVHGPSSTGYGELKLSPFWDPLRGNPCFEKMVASLAPDEN